MDVTMADARLFNLRLPVEYKTASEALADIDGEQMVESSNPAVASVLSQEVVDKVRYVVFELHGVAGLATITGLGDADLSEGERFLEWSFEINVLAEPVDEAQTVTVGTPELIAK